ncbi:MAG: UDP-3-O-(3-hydroxymyristoyl)glucosamine N-acyltransferase [Planctomycetota bacterium]
MSKITLNELAERLGGQVRGEGKVELTGCATLEDAGPDQLSFLNNPRYAPLLASTAASAVIVSPEDAERAAKNNVTTALLVVENPYFALRQAMVLLHGFRPQPAVGISPEAYLDETAEIGELCTVRPHAYVAPGAQLGDRVVLYPNVYVGKKAVIGNDCVLHPGVCVYDRCVLGDRVTLHANTVVGEDGLGYATGPRGGAAENNASQLSDQVVHHKIPQAGNAVIEDDVEMGANCSIDRAALGSTVVGAGSKLSNNVVIGHGVKLGRHNMIVAHVGIAGSTVTGDYVTMGGQAGLAGHLKIGDHVTIAADAKVMTDIPDGETWGGTPATPLSDAKRVVLAQQRVPEMVKQIKSLTKRLAELEARTEAKFS